MQGKSVVLKASNVLQRRTAVLSREKHWKSVEYQYWQRSKIPTMHFQNSLPRLPIPKLEDTCERYLAAQKPLLTKESFEKTSGYVKNFCDNKYGRKLQERLIDQDKKNKHTSYISKPWFDMYLSDRKPLPINYNPTLIFNNDPKAEFNDQLVKSANMIISSARFFKSLKDGLLEPEVYHMNPKKSDTQAFRTLCSLAPSFASWYVAYAYNAYPLDMSQYHNLFYSTRIPEINKDKIFQDFKAKHILVQFKGQFYTFNIFDECGDILPATEILSSLKYIINSGTANATCEESSLGILTTLDRNKWASLRQHLLSLGNEKQLHEIDSAFFNLCLDESKVNLQDVKTDEAYANLSRHYIHGDGTNRWFDKSFSLIISKDGVAGLNFEHSWGDGVAVLRYFQDIHQDSIENPQVTPSTQSCSEPSDKPQKLVFNLDDKLKKEIKNAIQNYREVCNGLEVNVFQMFGIGKNVCKKLKISPDSIMQLGFQDAYFKLKAKCVASYESCSTAAFKHGRTETIRPCTIKTKEYSEVINSKDFSKSEAFHLIEQCSKYHAKLTREAAMGQGFDRHLFALKLLAEQDNIQADIFQDDAYSLINQNIISTSTLTSPRVLAGGFGPTADNGFGIAYSIRDDYVGMLVTNNGKNVFGRDYIDCLEKAFKDIRDILLHKSKAS